MSGEAKDNLMKHSLLLLIFSNAANAMNVIFQALMGRYLPPSEYADMSTMMTMMLVLITPLDAIRTSFAHTIAVGAQAGRPWVARDMLLRWGRSIAIISVGLLASGIIIAPWLQEYFHLASAWPVRGAALILAISLFAPLLIGTYQGLQKFTWMAAAQSGWSVIRVAAGVVLVCLLARNASMALFSHAIGIAIGLAVSAWGLLHLTRRPAGEEVSHHPLGGYLVQSFFMLTCYAMLQNADVMLVKRHFPGADAELYSQAATIGRSAVFMPIPIAMVMFPKVVSVGASSRRTLVTLLKALGMGIGIVAVLVGFCSAFTWLPYKILFSSQTPTPEQLAFVRHVLWAMTPLTVTFMLMNFEMAQHRFRALPLLALCVAAYIISVHYFCHSLDAFVLIFGTVSTVSAVGLTAIVIHAHLRHSAH